METVAYYNSVNAPKIRPDSTSGDVKSVFGGTEKSNDGWLVLEKGDTLKGKHIIKKYHGTMIDLDGSNKVILSIPMRKGRRYARLLNREKSKHFVLINVYLKVINSNPIWRKLVH
ncbi:hypothetical protein [Paraflavitalea speifideaquila]|uniref:hypothetical protein n=1 Tax=Paraflavitalea speifideaquila TaxID=3076558 RepID=UPI0028E92007|nr:hypothetical protein [Paraflavitalea speifideiaquila]